MTSATAVAGGLWLAVALALSWLGAPTDTRPRRLKARLFRRWWRRGRSGGARVVLWFVSWPHLVDAALRLGRRSVEPTPSQVVWREHKAVLRRYSPVGSGEPVLVVHALVTKPWILDLTPTRSLVRALLDAGFDVYLLDWGNPRRRQSRRGLEAYAATLRAAEQAVVQTSAQPRVHLVAYCLAATLTLLDLATPAGPGEAPSPVASAALIAPPVDLHVDGGLARVLADPNLRPVLALDSGACVPAALVREAFRQLRPQALRSIRTRWARRGDREYTQFYAAMGRWAWHHRRLPGAVFFDLVRLHRGNPLVPAPGHRHSPLGGITTPLLVAVADGDHIVPAASSLALASVPGLDVTVLRCPSGHVSMLVGSEARRSLWPGLVAWLGDHQTATTRWRPQMRASRQGVANAP